MASGTDLALDLNPLSSTYKDIALVNGDFPMCSGTQQIQQNILQTLNTYRGEWFLDNTIGVDYYGTVLIKNPSLPAINAMLINAILSVAGVTSILSYSSQVVGRGLSVNFKVQTTNGVVSYQGTLP